jgi:hypothetical protein
MKNLTPITPEALIKLGFEKIAGAYYLYLKFADIEYFTNINTVFAKDYRTNATTIEDIKDLIRLFK